MKKSTILAFGIAAALGFSNAHALTLYCVHDGSLNDSQFCQGTPFSSADKTPAIVADGPVHHDCDIEALDVRFDPSGTIYAASGDDTPRPGHLYRVVAPGGHLFDLGAVFVDGVRMKEIDAISVLPSTGEIWGWSQGQGLFVIDPDKIPTSGEEITDGCTPLLPDGNMEEGDPDLSPTPIDAQEEISVPEPIEIEDLEWNFGGTILYGVENNHCGHNVDGHGADENDAASDRDYDDDCGGITLWAYFKDQEDNKFTTPVCTDVLTQIQNEFSDDDELKDGAEIEGLEALPRTFLGQPATTDTLVLTFHGPYKLRYAVITKPTLPLDGTCTLVGTGEIITSELNDIEGVGVSPTITFPKKSAALGGIAALVDQPSDQINPAEAMAEWEAFVGEAIKESPTPWTEELPSELGK